ncbi:MAG: hypothetical protein ABW292_07960, partial [Vicinamibacterales bacterium]
NSRPYRLASVETIPEVLDDRGTEALRQERERLTSMMSALYDQIGFPDPPPGVPDEQDVDELAEHLPLAPLARQKLLEQESPHARASTLVKVLEAVLKAPR